MSKINDVLATLRALFGVRSQSWEQVSGHSVEESFILIRIEGLKKGQLRRLHAQIEDVMKEEHGDGDRV